MSENRNGLNVLQWMILLFPYTHVTCSEGCCWFGIYSRFSLGWVFSMTPVVQCHLCTTCLTFDSKLHLRTFPVQKVAADLAFSRDLVTGEFFLWHWFNAMYQRTTCSTFDSNLETLGALVLQIVPSLAEQLYCTAIYCYDGIF